MPVTFHKKAHELGSYWAAHVVSPNGGEIIIDPFTPIECSVSHQNKAGKHGFGVKFSIKNNHRVLHVGTAGDAEKLLRDIKKTLTYRFWKQDEDEDEEPY